MGGSFTGCTGENFHAVQKHVGKGVTICAVVKADGYGHGAVECARALESEGAEWLGVTDAAEGLALRDAGVTARILLMTGIWKGEEDDIVAQNPHRQSGSRGISSRSNERRGNAKAFCPCI